MKISVKVNKFDSDNTLVAFVTVFFESEDGVHKFVVNDCVLRTGQKGLWLAYPSKKKKDDTYKDIAHPITAETRKHIELLAIQEYDKLNGRD